MKRISMILVGLVFTSLLFAQKLAQTGSPDTLKKAGKEAKRSKITKPAEKANKQGLKAASDEKVNPPQTHTGQNMKQPEVGKPKKPGISDAQVRVEAAKPAAVADAQDRAVPDDKTSQPSAITVVSPNTGSGIEEEVYAGKAEFKAMEKAPEVIKKVPPVYPLEAKQRKEQGKVILYLLIDLDGHVKRAEVAKSSGYPALDQAAADAVMQFIFTPAIAPGGKPVRVWVMYPVTFSLG